MAAGTELLLDGPRGRRLCLELAMELDPDIRTAVFRLGYGLDPGSGTSQILLTAASGDTALPPIAASPEQLAAALACLDPTDLGEWLIQVALGRSVDAAMYWQEPDGVDVLAGLPVIRAALVGLAEPVMTSPHTQWWDRPRRTGQWAIDWRSAEDPAPLPKDPRHTLAVWARNVRAEEGQAARERPRDPRVNVSGTWWSIPHGLVHTIGCLPGGLSLVEDSLGWEEATAVPVRGTGRTFGSPKTLATASRLMYPITQAITSSDPIMMPGQKIFTTSPSLGPVSKP